MLYALSKKDLHSELKKLKNSDYGHFLCSDVYDAWVPE